MITETGGWFEISEPAVVIFVEKILVARAVAHAHEPGSGDELFTRLRCLGLNAGAGQGGKWTKYRCDTCPMKQGACHLLHSAYDCSVRNMTLLPHAQDSGHKANGQTRSTGH